MKSSNKVVTLQRKDRQLRGLGQTLCEGRFGAHVLKKRALRHSPQNKGGTADNVRLKIFTGRLGAFFIAVNTLRHLMGKEN